MQNDVEIFHKVNSHFLKHEQTQNDNVVKFERD